MKRLMSTLVLATLLSVNCAPGMAQTVKPDVAVVTLMSGPVRLRVDNQPETALKVFSRIRMDDQIAVPAGSQLKIIYLENGRAELWNGAAQFRVGKSESNAQAGSPEVTNSTVAVRQVFARTQNIARTSGLGGTAVRGLRLPQHEEKITLAEIRETYLQMRKDLPDTDLTPEFFLMSATNEYVGAISEDNPK
jgi:hypothetical protein